MKNSSKLAIIISILLLATSLMIGGCATSAPKPLQNQTGTPAKPQVDKPAPTPAYPQVVANNVVKEAKMVDGVKGAAAVITGKTIYLGLDLQANLNKNKVKNVENMVLNRVKKSQPTYSITVTSDIDTVTRIKKVAQGIARGEPVTSFTQELQDIGNRIKPRMK